MGRLTSTTDAKGQTSFNYYDESGNLIAKVGPDAGGKRKAMTYGIDAMGNVVLEKQWANGASSASVDAYQLNQSSQKDRINQYFFDENGLVKERIDANGSAVDYSYDENGQVTRCWRMVHDARGTEHIVDNRYAYDACGNQIDTMMFERDAVYHQYARYNSFGELIEKNHDNNFKVTYEYDSQGRIWRSNSVGYYQIFVYDLEGQLTQVITSTNSFDTKENENGIDLSMDYFEDVISFNQGSYRYSLQRASNRYDRLGHLLGQVREKVETADDEHQGEIREACQSQVVDRWGNILSYTDPRKQTTLYTYNALNQLTSKALPEVAVMDEHGKTTLRSLKTAYYYNELGQSIAMTDANDHTVTKVYDAYGQVIEETDSLGHSRYREYDVFGNMSKSWQGDHQNETLYDWDANDKLLEVTHLTRQGNKSKRYVNDELGRRLSEENVTQYSALIEKIEYQYDNRGNLTQKTDARGNDTFYRYDEANHLVSMEDANHHQQSWLYNTKTGRLSSHTDLNNKTTRYEYNTNGLLCKETSDYGKDQVYHYYADGTVRQFVDNAKEQKINYKYDETGNIIRKESTQGGANKTHWILETDYYTYDALGRMVDVERVNPDDVINGSEERSKNPMFTIHYDYDAVNNIRHIYTNVDFYHTGHQTVKNYYFTYDANNRMLMNKGALVNDEIVITQTQGSTMQYNADGSVKEATKYANGHEKTWLYTYDEMGRVKDSHYYLDGEQRKKIRLQSLDYDDAGHVLTEYSYDTINNLTQKTVSSYKNGLLDQQHGYDSANRERSHVSFQYDAVGNMKNYVLVGTAYGRYGDSVSYTTTHTFSYRLYDDYQQDEDTAVTTGQSKTGKSKYHYDVNGNLESVSNENGLNTSTYLNDSREGIRAKQQGSKETSYLNVGGYHIGDIQIDHDSHAERLEVYAGFTPEGSAEKTKSFQPGAPGGRFGIDNSHWESGNVREGTGLSEFSSLNDLSWNEAIYQDADGTPGNRPQTNYGSYTVQNGDSLKSIALQVYGDSSLWYLIADANGLSNGDERAGSAQGSLEQPTTGGLQSGTQLSIPAVNDGQHFSSSTHKVYNPNNIIGDTSATNPTPPPPPPPPQKKVAFWKKLVVGIIVVAATVFTAGVLGLAMGVGGSILSAGSAVLSGTAMIGASATAAGTAMSMSAAMGLSFVAGVAGSLASQGVSMAMGIQDSISYKSALITGLATAATAGIGKGFSKAAFADSMRKMSSTYLGDYFSIESASRAMLTDGASQLGTLAIEGGKFNWAEFGGAGATGGLLGSNKAAQARGWLDGHEPTHGMVSSELSSLAGGGINALAMGNHFDAASVIANSLGSSALSVYQQYKYRQQLAELQQSSTLSDGYDSELKSRVSDSNGELMLSSKDISNILEAQEQIANLDLEKVDDGTDPDKVHVFVVFDGTWNDRDKMLDKTNPAILWENFDENKGYRIYERGVGTDPETQYLGGGFGLGAENRVNDAYEQLVDFINQTKQANPNAKIILSVSGFSRGATEARYFTNMVVDKGIPDLSSKLNGSYTRSFETPRMADLVIFDTVVAMTPYSNYSRGMKLSIPNEVEHVLHLTANDEQRRFFPLTSAIDPKNQKDSRITEIGLPGVHSDIGGSYHNAYSRIPLNMAYDYMDKLGIPLKPIGEYKAPSAFDTSLRLHDSRYTFDKMLDGLSDTFKISHHRRVYSAYS